MKLAFVQPYSLGDVNGGARILRSLTNNQPVSFVSCDSSPQRMVSSARVDEVHLPFRPHFGRIERTRFAWLPSLLDSVWMRRWTPRLNTFLTKQQVSHIHVVPHTGLDFAAALVCARVLSLPISVSIHDHPRYCFRGIKGAADKLKWVGKIWAEAQNRFVVSKQLGRAMNAEFGDQTFQVITDGVEASPLASRKSESGRLRIYFMGLFHQSYGANLQSLVKALGELARSNPNHKPLLTLRCGSAPSVETPPGVEIKVLPFDSEDQVRLDMESSDLLYLPLPFGEVYHDFVAYSLSTKMVTYLGSGRPILYHGPADSAAGSLLEENGAAVICGTLDHMSVADALTKFATSPAAIETIWINARKLADDQFNALAIHSRFWQPLLEET